MIRMYVENINMDKIASIIDWFLRVLQILTFVVLCLQISKKDRYSHNVKIEEVKKEDLNDLNQKFRMIYDFKHIFNGFHYFTCYPDNVDLKKVDIFELYYENNGFKERKLKTYHTILNGESLIIQTSVPCGPPNLRIKWTTNMGEKGEFTFFYNGFNGNLDMKAYKYKRTFKRIIEDLL